jgi:hypothetical protein
MYITNPFWLTRCPRCHIEYDLRFSVCLLCHTAKPGYSCTGFCIIENVRKGDIVPGKTKFINYDLTKEDKKAVLSLLASEGWLEQALHTTMEAELRVVLDYDAKQGSFSAMVFPKGEDGAFAGYSISARGSTAIKAAAVVLWKHTVLYSGIWPVDQANKGRQVDL